jgi:hypothetical protein
MAATTFATTTAAGSLVCRPSECAARALVSKDRRGGSQALDVSTRLPSITCRVV